MRHSFEPESVSRAALPLRSEIVWTPSSAARAWVMPTALESVNGVGGSAVTPALAKPALRLLVGLLLVLGDLRRSATPKNVVSAVPVYSG